MRNYTPAKVDNRALSTGEAVFVSIYPLAARFVMLNSNLSLLLLHIYSHDYRTSDLGAGSCSSVTRAAD